MYLGIDIGTSGVKGVLIDDGQSIRAERNSAPLTVERRHPNWSEQDPDVWWRAVEEVIDAIAAADGDALRRVRGIGLSGQMYGATTLGADDRPLRPAMLWNDTRARAECATIEAREPAFRELTGRRATAGATAPKLEWLRRHEPDLFDRVRTVLLPKDYVRLQLSGDKASDMSDSSGTLWLDVGARRWSDALLAAGGMRLDQMPALVEGTAPTGRLRPALRARWGMTEGPVVAGGGGDNACGACGVGIVKPGDGTVSLGTSGVLFVATAQARSSRDQAIESLCHAVPGVWHQMAVIMSASACLGWLARLLKRPAADLVAELGDAPRPATPLLFLPYLDGSWSPHDDQDIRGAFVGLSHTVDDAALTHSVLQGVAFALAEAAGGFRASGARFDRLLAIGGGSRSRLWLSILATCLDARIAVPAASAVSAALGAARLGMLAATGQHPDAVLTSPKILDTIEPDPSLAASYADAFSRWRDLYGPVRAAGLGAHQPVPALRRAG